MSKVIVSSCGSTSGIAILVALREAGVETVGADSSPDAVGLQVADSAELVLPANHPDFADLLKSVCSSHNTKMIIPTHSKELAFYAEKWRAWRKEGFKYMVPPPEALQVCDDKLGTARFMCQRGIRHPLVYDPLGAGEVLRAGRTPVFAKLRYGSGAIQTALLQSEEELWCYRQHVGDDFSVYQEYVEGPEYTVSMLSNYDGKVVGAVPVRRLVVRGGLSVLCESEYQPAVEEVARETAEALGLVGPSNVQVIVRKETKEPVVIEVNPRFASGSLPTVIASGLNVPLLMLDLMEGKSAENAKIGYGVRVARYYGWKEIKGVTS